MNHSERDEARLARSLQMLAEIEAASEAAPHVEAAVMSRWDASRRSGAEADRSRRRRVVRGAATAAAGITILGALAWQRGTNEPARMPDVVSGFGRTSESQHTTVAVVGGPLMADEPIRVVRMRVQRSMLGELGIPSPAQQGTPQMDTVDIDVLVGEDGVARGVRVPISEL